MAVPIGVLAASLLAVAWNRAATVSVTLDGSIFGRFAPLVLGAAVHCIGFPGFILVHELLHALGYPRFGFSGRTLIAAWPSRFLFYAGYLGGLSRNRWLFVYLLPFLVLSVLPLVVCRILHTESSLFLILSVVNGLFSGGDIFCVLLIWFQVPRTATMQSQGWSTWWKI